MGQVTKLVCPHCNTSIPSATALQVGKKVRCPFCSGRFIVRADSDNLSRPAAAGQHGQLNAQRLGIAVFSVLIYLLVGSALGVYCFGLNAETRAIKSKAAILALQGEEPPPPPAPPQPKKKATAPVSSEEQKKIDDAIVHGVWYLKKCQIGKTTPGVPGDVDLGARSLAALTLMECGVSPGDPQIQDTAKFVRQEALTAQTQRDTYQLALAILFLDRLGEHADEELIQFLALRIMAGQRTDDGGWGYSCPVLDQDQASANKLLYQLRDTGSTLDFWHNNALAGAKPFNPSPARSDNSNTQFAVLALWVAHYRHGVSFDKAIPLVDKHFSNHTDGTWWYCDTDHVKSNMAWPAMTCSGLLALAVVDGVGQDPAGKKPKPPPNPVVAKGLAVLANVIGDPNPDSDLYFLWSLERVAVLYQLSKINDKDWYGWGSQALLLSQQDDGYWKGQWLTGGSDVVSTCFALLFLKQANLVQDLSEKLDLLSSNQ